MSPNEYILKVGEAITGFYFLLKGNYSEIILIIASEEIETELVENILWSNLL